MNKQIQNVVTEMIDGINYQQMIGGEIFLNLKDVAIGLGFEREGTEWKHNQNNSMGQY